MATAPTTDIPEFASAVRTQIISGVQQSQKLTLEAAEAMAKSAQSLPIPELPAIPGFSGAPTLEALTKFSFDFATEIVNSQHDFALKLSKILDAKS